MSASSVRTATPAGLSRGRTNFDPDISQISRLCTQGQTHFLSQGRKNLAGSVATRSHVPGLPSAMHRTGRLQNPYRFRPCCENRWPARRGLVRGTRLNCASVPLNWPPYLPAPPVFLPRTPASSPCGPSSRLNRRWRCSGPRSRAFPHPHTGAAEGAFVATQHTGRAAGIFACHTPKPAPM